MPEQQYAKVILGLQDIKNRRPDWTDQECEDWLVKYELNIQNIMIKISREVVGNMLEFCDKVK